MSVAARSAKVLPFNVEDLDLPNRSARPDRGGHRQTGDPPAPPLIMSRKRLSTRHRLRGGAGTVLGVSLEQLGYPRAGKDQHSDCLFLRTGILRSRLPA